MVGKMGTTYFTRVRVAHSLVFCVVFCESLFVRPLYFLSVFDSRFLKISQKILQTFLNHVRQRKTCWSIPFSRCYIIYETRTLVKYVVPIFPTMQLISCVTSTDHNNPLLRFLILPKIWLSLSIRFLNVMFSCKHLSILWP
jgi:hypothetical protein